MRKAKPEETVIVADYGQLYKMRRLAKQHALAQPDDPINYARKPKPAMHSAFAECADCKQTKHNSFMRGVVCLDCRIKRNMRRGQ